MILQVSFLGAAGPLDASWRRSRMNTTGKLASIIMGRSQDKEDKEGDREMNAYKVPNPYFSFLCLFLSLLPTNVESTSPAEAETL